MSKHKPIKQHTSKRRQQTTAAIKNLWLENTNKTHTGKTPDLPTKIIPTKIR